MTVLLLGKCCPCSSSFIGLNRWKSEGTKSGLYSGCGTTVWPRLTVCSTVFKLVWGLALSCCKRKVVFFSGLALEIQAFSLASRCSGQIFCLGSRKSRRITPFLSQKTVHITLSTEGSIFNSFFDGEFTCRQSMDCHLYSGLVVTPHLITGDDVIQETVTFSLILVQ